MFECKGLSVVVERLIMLDFVFSQINSLHWAGWLVYSLFVLFSFIVMKVVNLRLHLSLGTDPVPEPEKEEESEEGSEEESGEQLPEEEEGRQSQARRRIQGQRSDESYICEECFCR